MATVTRTHVYVDGETLTAALLNNEFNNLLNALAIMNSDIAAGAAIATSKINYTFPVTAAGTTDTQTLTNKRITKRTETVADATTITPSWDSNDVTKQTNTQGSGTLTINSPSGTPVDMDIHEIAIKSTNSQTYSFNATYKGGNVALPTSHGGSSKWDLLLFQYSSTDTNWKLVGIVQAIS